MRGQLWYLRNSWNVYYLGLIDEYGDEVTQLLAELEAYLDGRIGRTDPRARPAD